MSSVNMEDLKDYHDEIVKLRDSKEKKYVLGKIKNGIEEGIGSVELISEIEDLKKNEILNERNAPRNNIVEIMGTDIEFGRYGVGWKEEFEKRKKEIKNVSKIVEKFRSKNRTRIFPTEKDWFNMFKTINLGDVKAVIWVSDTETLRNGKENLESELIKQFKNKSRGKSLKNFKDLHKEGVLILPVSFCTSISAEIDFSNVWLRFANIVADILNIKIKNCVHIMFGKKTDKIKEILKSKNIICVNSPDSWSFKKENNCFIKADISLKNKGMEPIDWTSCLE
jgi:uracil DNA glycosylase